MGVLHNLISIQDLTREHIDMILDRATEMEEVAALRRKILDGKIMACLFFEPSTRTRLSFESAMLRLGGSVLGFPATNSALKTLQAVLEEKGKLLQTQSAPSSAMQT